MLSITVALNGTLPHHKDIRHNLNVTYRLLGAAVLAILLCACGGGGNNSDEGDAADATVLLQQAADAVKALQSVHFKLDHENGTSPLPLDLRLVGAEGDVVVPDRLKAEIRARRGALNFDVDVISVGGKTWITNPFSGRFEELPNTDIRDVLDPIGLITVLTQELKDPKAGDGQELDGVDTSKVSGTIDSASLDGVLPVEAGRAVDLEMWLGKDDSLPRRVRLKGALTAADEGSTVRRVDFSRFNEKVEIVAPR